MTGIVLGVLIARLAHLASIRQNGPQVDGDMGNFIASVDAADTLNFRVELVHQVERKGQFLLAEQITQAFTQ